SAASVDPGASADTADSGASDASAASADSAGSGEPQSVEPHAGSIRKDLRTILGNRALLSICVIGVVFGVSLASITGHMSLFLTADLGYSPAFGGIGLAWFHIGGILGQPGWGYLNDRFFGGRRRRGLILLVLLTSGMSLFFALVVSSGYLPPVALFFVSGLLGFIVLGMPGLYFTGVSELVPAELTGLATGVALVFSRLGVVLAAPLFGLLSDLSGDYRLSWLVLSGFALCVVLGVWLMRVSAPKREMARAAARAE
ncbi:MAG: MFS transporter, partial [bacterium]